MEPFESKPRVDWVDYAKGICCFPASSKPVTASSDCRGSIVAAANAISNKLT
jgi:DNA-binding transcriptional regulator YdaS (Cro superfamily)